MSASPARTAGRMCPTITRFFAGAVRDHAGNSDGGDGDAMSRAERSLNAGGPPRYNVSSIRDDDLGELASFLSSHPDYPVQRLRVDTRYLTAKLGSDPRGCLARYESHVISSLALARKPLIWSGRPCTGAEATDGFTDAEHQRRGLFSTLAIRATASGFGNGYVAIYGTPNPTARLAWLGRCGYSEWPRRIVSLVHPVGFHRIGAPLWRAAAAQTVQMPDFAFWGQYEDIWHLHARAYGLAVDRTVAYLNWRFQPSLGPFQVFGVREGTRPAYLVTRTFAQGSEIRSAIADLWSSRATDRYALLARALVNAVEGGARWLTMWAPIRSAIAVEAMSLGFIPHRRISLVFKTEQQPARWSIYFMMGDSDNV